MKYKSILTLILLSLALFLNPFSAIAGDEDEKTKQPTEIEIAKSQLNTILADLAVIEPFIEDYDLGRIFILKKSVNEVLQSISTNGLGNVKTINQYNFMVKMFTYSNTFFERAIAKKVETNSENIKSLIKKIKDEKGLDEPAAMNIYALFEKVNDLLNQLAELPLSENIKLKLVSLKPILGDTLAASKHYGDRPPSFDQGNKCYQEIARLYPDFETIDHADQVFNLILEIRGLCEVYKEYAVYDSANETQEVK